MRRLVTPSPLDHVGERSAVDVGRDGECPPRNRAVPDFVASLALPLEPAPRLPQEGDKRSKVEIEAEEIGPSLKWASAKVEKQGRAAGQGDWAGGVTVGAGGPQEETPLDA